MAAAKADGSYAKIYEQYFGEPRSKVVGMDATRLAEDVLALLEREPELININNTIIRNEGYLKSLQSDTEHDV
jgi:hypothetical protein